MKGFMKQFCLRGMIAMGFGPIVLAIIYGIIGASGQVTAFSPTEVCKGFLSISVMAFIAGGIGGIYTLEHLPVPFAALIHAGVLYADYLILYLFNNWIPRSPKALGVFTGIFVLGFGLIWLAIYLISRHNIRRLNKKIMGGQ